MTRRALVLGVGGHAALTWETRLIARLTELAVNVRDPDGTQDMNSRESVPMPNLVLLYVKDPAASAAFYKDLLGREPFASFPTYIAFDLDGGFTLGLWSTQTVNPAPSEAGNRTELAFMVQGAATVEHLHADWSRRGIAIAQKPMTAVFGRTFVALDPDGHRLRVCCPDK